MKFIFDLFPVIVFFVAYKTYDIYVATAVAIAATVVQIGWTWFRHRKVDKMLWMSLAAIGLLGGATLMLQDELFIMWKPTVLYWLFSAILLISSTFFKKNLIQALLEKQLALPKTVWAKLNASWIMFFIFMGGINLHIAYGYSLDTWVNFKLFGSTGLMIIFVVAQMMVLGKYVKHPEEDKGLVAVPVEDHPVEHEMVKETIEEEPKKEKDT